MLLQIGWFALGVFLIGLGADSLVKGVAGHALRFGAGAAAVGLFAVVFGGSLPDLAVNVDAAWRGHDGIAFGNIIGSCIVNFGLVLGLAALVAPLRVRLKLTRALLPAMIAVALALYAMAHNGRLGYYDALALLAGFALLAAWVAARGLRAEDPAVLPDFARAGTTRTQPLLNVLRVVVGVVALAYGSELVVTHAAGLAQAWGLSELVAGLTFVAIATSLPQLALALRAAARDQGDLVVAGVLGSNLFNLLAILGATALVHPLEFASSLLELEIPIILAFALGLYPVLRGSVTVSRLEGAMLLLAFFALLAWQLARALS